MKRIIPQRFDYSSSVQQMNYNTTKDVVSQFFQGKNPDINVGNITRSYDFPDGNVDFNKPLLDGFENLIDQHVNRSKIIEHFHPSTPVSVDPGSPSTVDSLSSVEE